MNAVLVFDIETVPDVAGLRRLHGFNLELSDQEVSEKAFAMQREKSGSDFLPHYLQKIVAISCVFHDVRGINVRSIGDLQSTEEQLIQGFFKTIERYTPQLISWNGSGFDLPVLHYRSLVHGLSAQRYWEMGQGDNDFKWNNYINRYHFRHLDLMDLLALYNGRANAPLDNLSKLCGFPGKLGVDGSQVWKMVIEGQLQQVRDYCETDVMNTYLLYCRFQLLRGQFDSAAYHQEIEQVKKYLAQLDQPHWQEYLSAWIDG